MNAGDCAKLNILIAGVADGFGDSLDGIYEIAGRRMYAAALCIVGKDDAEDVLHDSLIKIARFAKKYKPDSNPYAWLLKIVRNTALDYLRKKKARAEICADELFNLSSADYSPEKRENAIMLEAAIQMLEPEEKNVIFCTYYLDMTVRDTAAMLKLSKSSVQRTLQRAETKLKNLLGDGTNG